MERTATRVKWSFPDGLVIKNLPANEGGAGDEGLIPGLERFFGVRNDNSLHYS